MLHELWKEKDGNQTFCFAGSLGDDARKTLSSEAELIWTVEAISHYDAMTKYYEFMSWGEYTTDFEMDKNSYPEEWIRTQK